MKDTIILDAERAVESYRQKIKAMAAYHSPKDGERICDAFEFAADAHKGQIRKSGEPYLIHPVEVACIIDELGLDVDSIVSGLLHDIIEDTDITYQGVKDRFGGSVAALVDGVTKLGSIAYSSREEERMEDLRKMFIAMAKDIRVIIIKLADRLHNMRTNQYWREQKRSEKALETMEIYAPLAHRLGMQNIKWELEDISLQILDPVGYGEITTFLDGRQNDYSVFLASVAERIEERVGQIGIECDIKYRLKQIYSIYRKLYGQNLRFEEIYDICAMRVIVNDLTDCYNILGIVHDLYKPVPGRFKDYISTPKPNGYQSLHTVVIGSEGIPFEVQIRTEEMDKTAEYGIAAHWKYKGGLRGRQHEQAFAWVRQLLEAQQDADAEDFIKNIKVDMFADEVYVFTPKGDVINLPQGATPIDFAYAIHSAVGNRMTGAKVNGRIVSIDYQLKSGEIVDIITSKTSGGPRRDWIQIVCTNSAKSKIKQWFKKERRDENIEQGKADLDRELKVEFLYDTFMQPEFQETMLKRFDIPNIEELYARIGYGGMAISRVIGKIKDESNRQRAKEAQTQKLQEAVHKKSSVAANGVIVEGLDNCLIKFAKCCTPIPGDSIIGFVTRGHGVSVHRKDCANVRSSMQNDQDSGRWLKTEWEYGERHKYGTALKIVSRSRVGMLADVVTIFSNMKINLSELNVKEEDGIATFYLTADVSGGEHLELLTSKLKKNKDVLEVTRNIAGQNG